MVCFFLSLLKRKLPQRCPKQGGGVKATFGQCPKGSSFFFRITSLSSKGLEKNVDRTRFQDSSQLLSSFNEVRFFGRH